MFLVFGHAFLSLRPSSHVCISFRPLRPPPYQASQLGMNALNLPGFSSGDQARGLLNFITDIRNCTSREAEQMRIDKELANIRHKFSSPATLSPYQRKKYVWKLVYIFTLGYEVDFGHMEIIALISSGKFSEKSVGYVAVSLLMKADNEMMTLVVNSVRNDLLSHNNYFQALALASIANIGGAEFAEALTPDVQRVLTSRDTDSVVRKKAALCLLKLFRTNPDNITHPEWAPQMARLLEERHLGLLLSAMSLLIALASKVPRDYEICVPYVIALLSRLVLTPRAVMDDYLYYNTPSPWLQVKFLKYLQLYPPPEDSVQAERLTDSLRKILTHTAVSDTVNKSNADHAILFEAVNVVLSQGQAAHAGLKAQALTLLGRFISVKEPNIRYLGLEALGRFAQLAEGRGGEEGVKKHMSTVFVSLKDADISVRRQALDLVFAMCDASNARDIVGELTTNLATADAGIREEMVLKIAVLAERYATDLRWYVDTVLQLIHLAGDYVADDVWHRIIQIVTGHKDLQAYAAENCFRALEARNVHEAAVLVGGYVLGEFGYLIAEQPGRGGEVQVRVLQKHFAGTTPRTKALLLSTYAKLENLYPEVRPLVLPTFEKYTPSTELELQQRACEYASLVSQGDDILDGVLQEMPAWPEDKESALEARLRKKQEASEDRTGFQKSGEGGMEDNGATRGGRNEGGSSRKTGPMRPTAAGFSGKGNGGGGGVEDLLNLGSGEAVNAGPTAALTTAMGKASISPASAEDDLLGITDSGGDTAASGIRTSGVSNAGTEAGVHGIPEEMRPRLETAFKALITTVSGVLFENDKLQVGIKHDYRGSQGKMVLFYGNKTSEALTDFAASVTKTFYLQMESQDPPKIVAAGEQAKQSLSMEVMKPFDYSDAPELLLSYTFQGQKHLYELTLPIVPTSFFEPVTLAAPDYMARWRSLEGQSRERQEILQQPANFSYDSSALVAFRLKILDGLHLAQAQGLDQNDLSLSAVGSLRTGTAGPDGGKISVGALLRIEVNAQVRAMRITARAVHGTVAAALVNTIKALVT